MAQALGDVIEYPTLPEHIEDRSGFMEVLTVGFHIDLGYAQHVPVLHEKT